LSKINFIQIKLNSLTNIFCCPKSPNVSKKFTIRWYKFVGSKESVECRGTGENGCGWVIGEWAENNGHKLMMAPFLPIAFEYAAELIIIEGDIITYGTR